MEHNNTSDDGIVGISATDSYNSSGTTILSVQFDRKSSFLANTDPKTSTPGRGVTKPDCLDMSLGTFTSPPASDLPSSISVASPLQLEEDESTTINTTLNFDVSSDPPSSPTILDTSESSSPATSPPRNEHRNLQQTCSIDPQSIPEIRVEAEPETLYPEDIKVPIIGFEVMEERAKFTVYKIQVQKTECESWFVFRRYTDFCHLNDKLLDLFPGIRLSLPPKRWFRSNYNRDFLDERLHGLQAFIDNVTGHGEICNSKPVREFFCFDDPPGPHDSLEESRALCDSLEESVYTLRRDLEERDRENALLREELELYRSQVNLLSKRLREVNGGRDSSSLMSPVSAELSIAECDMEVSLEPEADQSPSNKSAGSRRASDQITANFPMQAIDKTSPQKKRKTQVVPVQVHTDGTGAVTK